MTTIPFEISLKVKLPERTLKRAESYAKLRQAIMDSMLSEFEQATQTAQDLCPVGKTGNLKNSIRISIVDPHELRMIIGAYAQDRYGTYYGVFVEYGHQKRGGQGRVHARPFFRSPMWESFFRFRTHVEKLVKEGV